jgi:tetratricopeptide (TPR) repeat protein
MKNLALSVLIIAAATLLMAATFEEASKLYEQEKYEESIDMLKVLLKQEKNNLSYNRLIADAYFKLSQNPEAGMMKAMGYLKKYKKYFEKVAELDPSDIESRETLAFSYFFPPKIAGGNKKKARAYLAEIKQLSPKRGMNIEIEFLIYEKEFEQAENICHEYIRKFPEDSNVYYSLGMLYQQKEDYTKAFEAFETNLEKDNEAWSALYQIGRTAVFSETNLDRGVECLTQYLNHEPDENNPGLDSANWRLGLICELQGKIDQAILAYESGLKINPENKECKKSLKKIK